MIIEDGYRKQKSQKKNLSKNILVNITIKERLRYERIEILSRNFCKTIWLFDIRADFDYVRFNV